MKLRKGFAGALALCLALSCSAPALAANEGGGEAASEPKATVEIVAVKSSKTFEIGLNVTATDFKSGGVVLKIDQNKLEFVDWNTPATPVAVAAADTAWSTFSSVPSKGSDLASAKPAIAYAKGGYHYLYMGAEAFAPVDVDGRVVTVRLQLKENAGTDFDTLLATEGWDETVKGMVKLAAKAEGENISNAAAQITTMDENGVRKVYVDTSYTADGSASGEIAISADFAANNTTPSAGSGAGSSVASYGVTILDWDGSVLTTAALPQDDFAAQLTALMADAADKVQPALIGKSGYEFDVWLDYSKAAPLIETDQLVTANNESIAADAAIKDVIVDPAQIKTIIAEPATGITLMAAYKGTAELIRVINSEGKDSTYTVAPTYEYNRYGYASANDGKYSVKVTVSRASVERLKKAAVVAQMSTGTPENAVFSLLEANNSESFTFELVPTRDMQYVAFSVVDIFGVSAWPNAGSRTGAAIEVDMKTVIQEGTISYILQQAEQEKAHQANPETAPASEWAFVDTQAMTDAKGSSFSGDLDAVKDAILKAESLDRAGLLDILSGT